VERSVKEYEVGERRRHLEDKTVDALLNAIEEGDSRVAVNVAKLIWGNQIGGTLQTVTSGYIEAGTFRSPQNPLHAHLAQAPEQH
jgi:hypothetical protein